jgi:hypothetical protein
VSDASERNALREPIAQITHSFHVSAVIATQIDGVLVVERCRSNLLLCDSIDRLEDLRNK